MKNFNSMIIFSILMIFTSCIFEKKEADIVKIEMSELLGSWIQTSSIIEGSENPKKGVIHKINFKDDFTAEIEIIDSMGYRNILGNWEINKEYLIGSEYPNVTFISDVILQFNWNDNHRQILALKFEEKNNKKMLTVHENTFEKE